MNVVGGGGNSAAGNVIGGQQQQQQQQQQQHQHQHQHQHRHQHQQQGQVVAPQISRHLSLNATTPSASTLSPARRNTGLPTGTLLGVASPTGKGNSAQLLAFDSVTEQDIQRQMDDFNKTVTIVLWYKAKAEPLRIQHMIRSFPFFQLASLTSIIHDLGLTDDSYLDTYVPDPGHWEQHTIHTVRIVETQQRLLYRIRKSLLEDISEEDCLCLPVEIENQKKFVLQKNQATVNNPRSSLKGGLPTPLTPAMATVVKDSPKNVLKRPATELSEGPGPPPTKVHVPNSFYVSPQREAPAQEISSYPTPNLQPAPVVSQETTQTGGGDANTVASHSHTVSSPNPDYLYQNPIYYSPHPPASAPTVSTPHPHARPPDTTHLPQSEPTSGPIAYHPHMPLKRWPNDYTVSEISAGFHDMDRLVVQTANMTQRAAFERVFGSRYVKSTVCRHRGVWRRASRSMRDQFSELGNDERASWSAFVRAVEGRQSSKASSRGRGMMPSASHDVITFSDGESGTQGGMIGIGTSPDGLQGQGVTSHNDNAGPVVEEPIMDSLQNPTAPGPTSASNASLQNDINVFDAALSHISSNPQT
ncbi:hypothetical protein AX17_004866 [Amanita inopinata Kibby_2008]|nr:hypothetical protein AX17_004866 [Amanita inopinata Kibby_2008]